MIQDRALLTAILAALSVLLVGVALLMVLRGLAARTLEQRIRAFATPGAADTAVTDTPADFVSRFLAGVGEMVRGRTRLYSERDIAALETLILASGLKPRSILPILLGIKVVLLVGVPAAALLYAQAAGLPLKQEIYLVLLALPVGILGPDWTIAYLRRPYLRSLRRGVPDALDLLVICTEAGMGLESALEHVSQEMTFSNPPIALALSRLLDDIRVLPDRRDAFRNFAERTGVDGARRVSTMMAQSVQYGTPLSQALRAVAIDLRRERMQSLESRAARLPVLLTLPLILFIMPSLFIVLIGPTVMGLS
ncbi:MAG TPA: type II secretion system F family protein, partial [Rhodopila sp.]|nr:type II secretion system F family protein [Rhodopila sp.]